MVKVDLITGFLGSGKTTFIKKYAAWLMSQGQNIGILENDFGAVNVDMMMLQDLMGDQCELEMISGGCDPETHRRRFKTKLISMGMCGYDRILVEPSGIFDVDEFFDILHEEPLDRWYEPGSVITIVDANLEEEMSEEENYILASEAASAGKIVFSKIGKNLKTEKEAQMEEKGSIAKAEESISKVLAHINIALKQIKCERVIEEKDCLCKNWDTLTKADFQDLMSAGYTPENYQKLDFEQDSVFESLYFLNKKISVENMKKAAVVTGASSGIGLAISRMLVKNGYEVFGIARDFSKVHKEEQFNMIECDITDTEKITQILKKIMSENELYILINNAGVGYYGLHEELNAAKIKEIVRTNFEAPMILSQLALRQLKKSKGFIINISSVTALQPSPHGCAYGASKAGLTAFSRSLFDEARKYGVKVVSVHPDMTSTDLYRNADFKEDEDMAAHLEPQEVAQTVEYIINIRDGAVIQEITIKPQFHRIRRK